MYVCLIEQVFHKISEGVQTCRQPLEQLYPSEYLNLPLIISRVEHSLANYIIIKNNLGKIKYFMESDRSCFPVQKKSSKQKPDKKLKWSKAFFIPTQT